MSILILVEGRWDQLFVEKIVKPLIKKKYKVEPSIPTYRQLKKEKVTLYVNNFINKRWFLLADHDNYRSSCIQSSRTKLKDEFSLPSIDNICLTIRDIEDWYSLGISQKTAERLAIPEWYDGKFLGKDFFEKHWTSEIDLRTEILNGFSIKLAMRSDSFKYFLQKLDIVFE